VANLGQEAVFDLPQNPPPMLSWDVELMEAKDTAHEGFRLLIEQCNQEITLALLAQTLTTSMPAEGGSSYAAARVHAGVLQGLLEADARALAFTIYRQLARPFAMMNFGNADLAPVVTWDVTPFEDAKTKAESFAAMANGFNVLRTAGFKLSSRDVRRLLRSTIPGFDIGKIESVEPLAIQQAKAKPEATSGERSRIASLFTGARFDPRVLDRVRVNMGDDAREAMAEIETAYESHKPRRSRWTW